MKIKTRYWKNGNPLKSGQFTTNQSNKLFLYMTANIDIPINLAAITTTAFPRPMRIRLELKSSQGSCVLSYSFQRFLDYTTAMFESIIKMAQATTNTSTITNKQNTNNPFIIKHPDLFTRERAT